MQLCKQSILRLGYTIVYFVYSNCFRLVMVMVDPIHILGARQGHALNGMAVHFRALCTHAIIPHLRQFREAWFWVVGENQRIRRKPEKTHTDIRSTRKTHMLTQIVTHTENSHQITVLFDSALSYAIL